jgi:hypothetical protein
MNRRRVGEDRGSKEMDGCPLTVADVIPKVTVSADVAGLAVSVAGLCKRFECLGAVDIHRDARW